MKTTIDIPPHLLKKAKQLANEKGVTLKTLIERGLEQVVAQRGSSRPSSFRLSDQSFSGEGLQQGLNWEEWSEIRSRAYEGRGGGIGN